MPARRALVCSKNCGAELSVIRAIIEGRENRRYGCHWDYVERKRRSRQRSVQTLPACVITDEAMQ
jgi:hypothetical protein